MKDVRKIFSMKAMVEIKNLKSDEGKHTIVRNLHRILDIRILDIDIENGRLYFLYASPLTLQKVKRELIRIGYPVRSCACYRNNPAQQYQYGAKSAEVLELG